MKCIKFCSVTDPCQRAVVFSPDSRLLVTGGADGVLRVWNFPEMIQRNTINASKKEISDVDISPDRKLVSFYLNSQFQYFRLLILNLTED